jgi:amino acid adenylation domain-containing protein
LLTVFEFILSQVIDDPNIRLCDLDLIDEKTKIYNFERYNGKKKNLEYQIIPKYIEENAIEMPEKIAVTLGEDSISYKDLNNRANVISHYLMSKGLEKGYTVSILLNKSIESVVCMLAIMKCGAICLTIDPSNPKERIEYLLSDSNTKYILTSCEFDRFIKSVPNSINIQGLNYNCEIENPKVTILGEDVAYVIYTSGSTGNPKASLIQYKSLANLFNYLKNEIGISTVDVVQQFASLSFDASILEIFGTLVIGATLAIVPDDVRKEPDKLISYWNEKGITYAILPPSMMPFLDQSKVKTLRIIMNVGEEAIYKYAKDWGEKITYVNGYGPSETSIWATTYIYNKSDCGVNKVPIGRPIQNAEVLILNKSKEVVDGMPGELCIGGIVVSKGYLNRDQLNKEKFFIYPYEGNTKFYRTGDLCRRLPNGNLEFLGRIDDQVKIRGHRIEISEIEKCMISVMDIKSVVICIEENSFNNKFLAAYIISNEKYNLSKVRNLLKSKLPDYMIPEKLMQVDKIPMTINGKIDRKKLSELKEVRSMIKGQAIDKNEKEILEIVSEILQLEFETINVNATFVDLGGDSISAIRASLKFKEKNINIKVNQLIENNSIKELAVLCEQEARVQSVHDNSDMSEIAIDSGLEEDYDTINTNSNHIQLQFKGTLMQRWISNQPSVISGHFVVLKGNNLEKNIKEALKKIISAQAVLRSGIKEVKNDILINEFSYTDRWYIPYDDISSHTPQEITRILNIEKDKFEDNKQFINKKLASNLVVYRTSENEHIVVLRIHHALWDAKSAEIFERNLNLILRGDELINDIKPYSEFVNMINQELLDDDKVELFGGMKNTLQKCMEFEKVKTIQKNFYNIPISLNNDEIKNFAKHTWGNIGNMISLLYEERFKNDEIYFMILYHSRGGKARKFKDTMGLFLDLIPVKLLKGTKEDMDCQIMNCIKKFKDLKFKTILNTLDLYNNSIEHIKSNIIVNYLGMFDLKINQHSNEIQKMNLVSKNGNNSLIISFSNSYLNIGMFILEEDVKRISKHILDYFTLQN